jgi:hypothetical protein
MGSKEPFMKLLAILALTSIALAAIACGTYAYYSALQDVVTADTVVVYG